MWAVSNAFLQALTQSHTAAISCTLTSPGNANPLPLTLAQESPGQVSAQSGQVIRRTVQQLRIAGTSTVWQRLATPGATISISAGIDFGGGTRELVPLIKGELSSAATDLGDGLIGVSLADYGQRLQASPFLTAYSPASTAGRIATISQAVTGAVPTTVTSTASDTGAVGTSNTWSTDRAGMITALLTDAGAEGFFRADGSYLIRDLPLVTNPVAWAFKIGDGGTIKNLSRQRPLDKLYNTVTVQPGSLDGSQTWTQVVAQITDTSNPRHPNYIGTRPYPPWQSPTILTLAQAQTVAAQLLTKLQGSTETLSLGAVWNPALEVGDVVRVTVPTDTGTAISQHLIDSLTVDLGTQAMTLTTRSAQEVLA